jgi:glyoxylase-like metal-dependent hydrolase (beta-lactamase superfamily II)
VLHTPGHTPEHISLLVSDGTRGAEPWFVLTGHTLMVGDMGRTELASTAEDGARALFRSAERLRELPDHVEILPGAAGFLADRFGMEWAIGAVAGLTIASGLAVLWRMPETLRRGG